MTGAPSDAERIGRADDAPVLATPNVIEGNEFAAIRVANAQSARAETGFAAFLDGTQEMRVINQSGGIPIVWGTVSAAVRSRVNRRLVSWALRPPIVRSRFYLPFRYVEDLPSECRSNPGFVDTVPENSSQQIPSRHPAALMEAAVKKIQQDREQCERELAEAWCSSEAEVLYADGSVTSSGVASRSRLVVGVIKSHRHLYAEGAAFPILVGLEAGYRSSVFRVSHQSRNAVASWYVRIRPSKGRDALFGLVRVEAAMTDDVARRADEISRWLIAEGAPLALPDGRWDKMAYGIRNAEEFLRAIS